MKISILHLSDIHIKDTNDHIFIKKTKIFDAIKNELLSLSHLFIVISGDITYSGCNEEYDAASKLIGYLNEEIAKYNTTLKIEIITVPGNHDCDFSTNNESRKNNISCILKDPSKIDKSVIDICTSVQNNYFIFEKKYNNDKNIDKKISDKLLKKHDFLIGEHSLTFNCYNLSWLSNKDERQAELLFPYTRYDLPNKNSSGLTISLMHHPIIWLNHLNARPFMGFLEKTSNIIISGHEHVPTASFKQLLDENTITNIEAGVLHNEKKPDESYFKLIHIDLDRKTHIIIDYLWDNNDKIYKSGSEKKEKEIFCSSTSWMNLNSDYLSKISNIGIKLSHPHKSNVILDDFFIHQDLINLRKNNTNKKINSSVLYNTSFEGCRRTIIFGEETSGKTTLSLMIQKNLNSQGKIAIYISGKNISEKQIGNFSKLIDTNFKEQYRPNDLFRLSQVTIEDVYIIIDDFDKSKLNSEYRAKLIEHIKQIQKNIIIFSNDSLEIEIQSNYNINKVFDDFEIFKIAEFGYVLSDKLIEKWVVIGNQSSLNRADIVEKKHKITEIIDTTIGKNFIPRYPIYLLTILQAIEVGATSELKGSAFCHYYHFLIVQSLGISYVKPDEFELYFSYLSDLAYYYFINERTEASLDQIKEFNARFCNEKEITIDENKILSTIVNAKLIFADSGFYYFSQNYIYYYFVSKYLSEKIDLKDTQDVISEISRRLYNVECANIIIFLIHHSKKPFISNQVLAESRNLFKELIPASFSLQEIHSINKLIEKDIQYLIEEKSIDEARNDRLESKDENNGSYNSKARNHVSIKEDIKKLDIFSQLNLSFKLMEILGQICKNYWASIDGSIKYDSTFGNELNDHQFAL